MQRNKKIIALTWSAILGIVWLAYLLYPQYFSQEFFENAFRIFPSFSVLIFLFVFSIRGLTLLPSTVLILAGSAVFSPFVLIILSVLGTVISSSIVYFFAGFLGFKEILYDKFQQKTIQKYEHKLNAHGFLYVTLWASLPFVPTDLMSALAGISHMKYRDFALGIALGGLPLIVLYAYVGENIIENLF